MTLSAKMVLRNKLSCVGACRDMLHQFPHAAQHAHGVQHIRVVVQDREYLLHACEHGAGEQPKQHARACQSGKAMAPLW